MSGTAQAPSQSSSSLHGRHLLVLGAAGEVGEALVAECIASGAVVTAMSRSGERLDALRQRLARDERLGSRLASAFRAHVGELDTAAESDALQQALRDSAAPLDGVIASLGGWRQGHAVTATSLASWHEVLDQSLTAHFLAARALLPLLADRAGSSYCFINGGAALSPVPGAGPMCVSAAAQLMLMRVLAEEHAHAQVRINALVLATPVLTRSRPSGPPTWLTAAGVGRYAARLASDSGRGVRGQAITLQDVRDLDRWPDGGD